MISAKTDLELLQSYFVNLLTFTQARQPHKELFFSASLYCTNLLAGIQRLRCEVVQKIKTPWSENRAK